MDYLIHENIEIQSDIQVRFTIYEYSNLLINNHWHNSIEILLIKSGKMQVWISDRSYDLEKDDFIIINSMDIHATKTSEPTKVQLLQIPYSFLKAKIPDIEHIHFEPASISDPQKKSSVHTAIYELLSEMGNAYYSQEGGYALKFSSILYHLLYLLVKECKTDITSNEIMKNDIIRNRLMLVINYVKEHYAEPISLKDAASLISLNQEYFCRFFKKYMGTTFLDYVNEIRLSHIYEDLLNTGETITRILETHGFTNYKLFIKKFHEKYGCTPMKKRKQP